MLFSTLPAQLNLADGRVLNAEVVTEDAAVQLHPLELAAHSHPMSESLFRDNLARYHAIGIKLDDQWIGFALISMVVGEAELLVASNQYAQEFRENLIKTRRKEK